jgi:histidinol-phosphate aminotransferase
MLSKRMDHLTPYVAGEQPRDKRYIKLNTNENPYPPTGMAARYLQELDPEILKLYPDPKMTQLRETIAQRDGVRPDCVFAGNGSDEVLSFCFYSFFDTVAFPELTYSFYPVYSEFYAIPHSLVPMKADMGIDLDGFLKLKPSSAVIIANPNSPTGMYMEVSEIAAFLDRRDSETIVVVDEAYIDFGGESCTQLIDSHKDLVVVKTLSKSHSLAGLRLGYAIGNERLIDALFTVKDSFNSYSVHTLAQELAVRALSDTEENDFIIKKIITSRDWTAGELVKLGWKVFPSKANFLFCSMPGKDGFYVYDELKKRGILVRYFDKDGLRDFVRITIGTEKQMQALLRAIEEI